MERELPSPPPPIERHSSAPDAQAMNDAFWGGGNGGGTGGGSGGFPPPSGREQDPFLASDSDGESKKRPATETIGRRAGSLSDELDFPEFVASLIHGTWDAMVDSSIRQMDAFADLVAAISKPVEQFRDENISVNQARDWLAGQHPGELELADVGGSYTLLPRGGTDDFGEGPQAEWLSDYGLAGESLTGELIDEQLIPQARDRMARDRMQSLATLVMLGMQRIKVDDGSITARLRFRAAAADRAAVDYAVSDDPASAAPSGSWSTRGSTTYASPVTKVSTVGVNAQTDSSLNAELFGQVKINFSSESLPLDRFVDDAQRVLLERAARPAIASAARQVTQGAAPQQQVIQEPAQAAQPAAQPVQQPVQSATQTPVPTPAQTPVPAPVQAAPVATPAPTPEQPTGGAG